VVAHLEAQVGWPVHRLARATVTGRIGQRRAVGAARRRSALSALTAVAFVFLAACSKSSTGPGHGSTGVAFVTGNGQSDTVQAALVQALVVRVVTPAGQAAAHQVVQFVTEPDSLGAQVYVEPLSSQNPTTFVADTTDASGQTSVVVVMGFVAGPGHLVVRVPVYGYSDTAVFTIKAGNAAGLTLSPPDTAVFVDSSVTFTTAVVDRFGNHRSDPVALSVVSGPATLSGTRATATAVGRVVLVATAGKAVDTAGISAVPLGTLAAGGPGGIVMFNLDGSNYHLIATVPAGTVKWAPSGTQLAFDETIEGEGGGNGIIGAVDLSGAVTQVDNSATIAAWPQVSRDGMWVYYCRISNGAVNWRARLDGSGGSDSLLSQMPDVDIFETPSSDGLHIAYVADHSGASDLRVLTLATGAVTSLGLTAWSPTWSPTSDLIAYLAGADDPSPVAVVHSNGSGPRTLTANTYFNNIDWSPDGQWIVALNAGTRKIDLINATSGMTLPLPFTGSQWSPTWKPK
jgi:hypothetical protein